MSHDVLEAGGATTTPEEGSSLKALTLSLIALLLLAGLSLVLRFAHLGDAGFFVALGIAFVKAVIVAILFMELWHEKPTVRFAFGAGLSLFALFLSLVVADVVTRATPPLENPPGTAPRAHG
jgi:cytochrome c oxidase subunit 4